VLRAAGIWKRHVDRIIAHNPFTAGVFVASGIPAEKIDVVDNFSDDPGNRTVRPSESDEVLAIARLTYEKGIDRLVTAWKHTKTALRLTVIGSGPELSALRAKSEGVEIRFLGSQSRTQIRDAMLRARATMIPSRWYESQPMTVIESMASGLAPFASDHPPLRWMLESLNGPLLVDHSDRAWENAVRFAEDDELVDRMGYDARALYQSRFSPTVALPRLERVYGDAIEQHGRFHRTASNDLAS
jgi:glycosyltransferase involved in cell wall biosynthesis